MAIYGENTKKQLTCEWPAESWIDIGRGLGALAEKCEQMQMDAEIDIKPDYDGRRMISFKMVERKETA